MNVTYKPIGIIRSPNTTREGTPIQGRFAEDVEGVIEIYPDFIEGLRDLDDFSHIFVLYHFHKSQGYSLEVTPFLDDRPHGLFSTRAPKRPNPIGLSVMEIKRIEGGIITVAGMDALDGTPVLDIKPFVPDMDHRPGAKQGWLEGKLEGNDHRTRADGRFK